MPRSGQKLAQGGKVILYTTEQETSSLKEVPSVEGMSFAQASSTLEAAGFNMSSDGKDLTEDEVYATTQSPAAGTLAEAGSVVKVDFVHESESEWVNVEY